MTPSKIGPYRIESKLGTGGMGEVYRAVDERRGRPVAIKRVSDPMAKKGREPERLRREARAVAQLRHPSIVELVGFLENDEGHWLVMELVEGRSLTRILKDDGPLGVGTAVVLFQQVAEALAEAHEQGILHRDLKTDNLMVNRDGCAKLLDFGLALLIQPDVEESRLTIDGRILGTPHAMSPEQARGWDLDHRSDLFSLGTLLYESLTATKPFLGADPMESLRRVCFTRQKSLRERDPNVPRELSWLVDRLLEKDPRQRPQETREVAKALARLLDDGTVPKPAARRPDTGEPARRKTPPNPVRPRHLDVLHDRWRRAAAGDGQAVLIAGAAGAGKSRAVAAFQRGVRSREMTWLACRCSPFETETDFAPLVDLLRRLVEVRRTRPRDDGDPGDPAEALEVILGPHAVTTGVVRLIAGMLEGPGPSPDAGSTIAGEEPRRQVLETFLGWLEELAEKRPAVLVFEELQWADPATLELLTRLAGQVERLPMLLLLTFEPGFQPPAGPLDQATRLTVTP